LIGGVVSAQKHHQNTQLPVRSLNGEGAEPLLSRDIEGFRLTRTAAGLVPAGPRREGGREEGEREKEKERRERENILGTKLHTGETSAYPPYI